jgi:putative transposase
LIVPSQSEISIRKQTELLQISRASLSYQPVVNERDLTTMSALDELYTKHPFYGSRRMRYALKDDYRLEACREHVQRLMRLMGLEAIYPKQSRNTSIPDPSHKKYPYLLNGVIASHPNHIWGIDITYIRLEHGWCYLMAILDWYSRHVVAWELSETMESGFCIIAMERALHTAVPDIANMDQGSQFTDHRFTGLLTEYGAKISMDGRGRCMDNIFTERLWRTVKYEEVYLKSYRTIEEAHMNLSAYFRFYNNERRHQSLDYRTPHEVYYGKTAIKKSARADSRLTTRSLSILSTRVV